MAENEKAKEELDVNDNPYICSSNFLGLNEYKEPICMYCETAGETGGVEFNVGSQNLRFCPDCIKKMLQCAVAVTKEYHKEKLS